MNSYTGEQGNTSKETAEFRSNHFPLEELLKPNQTLYVDIELKRYVDQNVFRLLKRDDFKPKGKEDRDFSGIPVSNVNVP